MVYVRFCEIKIWLILRGSSYDWLRFSYVIIRLEFEVRFSVFEINLCCGYIKKFFWINKLFKYEGWLGWFILVLYDKFIKFDV